MLICIRSWGQINGSKLCPPEIMSIVHGSYWILIFQTFIIRSYFHPMRPNFTYCVEINTEYMKYNACISSCTNKKDRSEKPKGVTKLGHHTLHVLLSKVLANEIRRYVSNVFSHWLRSRWVVDRNRVLIFGPGFSGLLLYGVSLRKSLTFTTIALLPDT